MDKSKIILAVHTSNRQRKHIQRRNSILKFISEGKKRLTREKACEYVPPEAFERHPQNNNIGVDPPVAELGRWWGRRTTGVGGVAGWMRKWLVRSWQRVGACRLCPRLAGSLLLQWLGARLNSELSPFPRWYSHLLYVHLARDPFHFSNDCSTTEDSRGSWIVSWLVSFHGMIWFALGKLKRIVCKFYRFGS